MNKDYKSIDVVVTGLEEIDKSIKIREDETIAFDEAVPKLKRKNKLKAFFTEIFLTLAILIVMIICLYYDLTGEAIFTFFVGGGCIIAYMIAKSKNPNQKLNIQIEDNNRLKQVIEYMKNNKQDFNLLLSTKDKLFDYYIRIVRDGYVFSFFVPIEKDDEEIGEYHELFIDEFKLVNKTKYTVFEIEEKTDWSRRYKTTLSIPYDLYKQIKTWQ